MNKKVTYKFALAGVLCALALISFLLENLFPPLFIPGARMGISNLFILLTAILCGVWYGAGALLVKSLLGSVFTGNFSAIMYSLPAGIVGYVAEVCVIYLLRKTSVLSASVLAAVLNSAVQNIVFCAVAGDFSYLIYLPYVTVIGAASGAFVGVLATIVLRRLPIKFFPNGKFRGLNDICTKEETEQDTIINESKTSKE